MYGSSFCIVTDRPRHLSSRPRDEAVRPFPRLDATPPVTKMCWAKTVDLHLEDTPRDRVGAGDLAPVELVGFPDVDDDDLLAVLEARLEVGRRHLGDRLQRLEHELLKGLGGRHGPAGYWLALPAPHANDAPGHGRRHPHRRRGHSDPRPPGRAPREL